MLTVTKVFEFEAAHNLPDYDGDCRNIHGHSYKLEVTTVGEVDQKTGMVVDFKLLSRLVKSRVIENLDHQLLNDHISNPTAENIVSFIRTRLEAGLMSFGSSLYRVRLWETSTSYCEWVRD